MPVLRLLLNVLYIRTIRLSIKSFQYTDGLNFQLEYKASVAKPLIGSALMTYMYTAVCGDAPD